jgi:hypothetical protein
MSPLTTKAQRLNFKSKTPWSTTRRPIKPRKVQEGHIKEGNRKIQQKARKAAKPSKMAKKSSEGLKRAGKTKNQHRSLKEQEKLNLKSNAQNQHKIPKSILPLKSTPPSTLNVTSPP